MNVSILIAILLGAPPLIQDFPEREDVIEDVGSGEDTGPTDVRTHAESFVCAPIVDVVHTPPTHLGVLLEAEVTEEERVEVETQISRCARKPWRVADPWQVLSLIRLEDQLGVPESMKGILGAAWCWEGAMRPTVRAGDPGGISKGFFQMQEWFWSWCGLPMTASVTEDLLISATCYWSRVEYYAQKTSCDNKWVVAEALAANGKKYANYGCKAQSLHVVELKRWRK